MSITRNTLGFLFSDAFTRADGAPGANWSVQNGTVAIVSNKLRASTAAARARAIAVADQAEIVVQCDVTMNGGAAGGPIIRTQSGGNSYYLQFNSGNAASWFKLTAPATYGLLVSDSYTYSAGVAFPVKMWSKSSFQRAYVGAAPVTINATDASFNANNGTGGIHLNSTGNTEIDNFVLYKSNNVVCSGLPTGYKIRVGTRTATESSGTATLDLLQDACPRTKIEILDGSNNLVEELTPTDVTAGSGVWGGDVYTFSPGTPPDAPDVLLPIEDQVIDRELTITLEDVSGTGSGGGTLEYKVEYRENTGASWSTLIDWTSTRPVAQTIYAGTYTNGNEHQLRAYARRSTLTESGAGTTRTFTVLHDTTAPDKPTLTWVWHSGQHLGFRISAYVPVVSGAYVDEVQWQIDDENGDFSSPTTTFTTSGDDYRLGVNSALLTSDTTFRVRARIVDDLGNIGEWSDVERGKTARINTHLVANDIRARDSSGNNKQGSYVSRIFTGGSILHAAAQFGHRFPAHEHVDPAFSADTEDRAYRTALGDPVPDVFCVRYLPSVGEFAYTPGSRWPEWSVLCAGTPLAISGSGATTGIFGFRDPTTGTALAYVRLLDTGEVSVYVVGANGSTPYNTGIFATVGEPFLYRLSHEASGSNSVLKFNGATIYSGAALTITVGNGGTGSLQELICGHNLNGAANVVGGSQCFQGIMSEFAFWWGSKIGQTVAATPADILAAAPSIWWRFDDPTPPTKPSITLAT